VTVAWVAAVLLYIPLSQLGTWWYLAVLVVAALVGVYLCGKTSRDWGVHDHGAIVWDEFVGYWITMFLVPVTWYWILAGFILFRLFDIWKPWPVRYFDKHVHGGLGIMLDDVVAGIMAWIVLFGLVQVV